MTEQIVTAQHQQDVARRYLRAVETWDLVVERNKNAETARLSVHRAQRLAPVVSSPGRDSAVSAPSDCRSVVARYFSDVLTWAMRVVWRESNCQPGAINWRESCGSGSHAEGLFQLCYPMHAGIFANVGCSNPLDGDCNARAARALYNSAGRSPWGG